MYIPENGKKEFFVLWKVKTNGTDSWLTKEDCPSKIHSNYQNAKREANRLTNQHKQNFVILRAIAMFEYHELNLYLLQQ